MHFVIDFFICCLTSTGRAWDAGDGRVGCSWLSDVVVAGVVYGGMLSVGGMRVVDVAKGMWVVSRSWSDTRYAFCDVWCTCNESVLAKM